MNFEPQKFFIGLMDFFSILLPGALLAFLLMDTAGPVLLGSRYQTLDNIQASAVFLFVSYLLGHFVFLLGSPLDIFYDWARRHTVNAQIYTLARRGRLLPWLPRALVSLVFKNEGNLAVNQAIRLKNESLAPMQATESINAFQWCKIILMTENPACFAVVQRFEADSKFFRCFTVVLLLVLIVWPLQEHWPAAGIPVVIVLLLLALWRYMEQRLKATNQAYWSVISLSARSGKVSPEKKDSGENGMTHAGGVVYRTRHGTHQFLLVEASNNREQWVLPKGHIEDTEDPCITAVREVLEETGCWARIESVLNEIAYVVDGKKIVVSFFLMRRIGNGPKKDGHRRHIWLPIEQALVQASHLEARALLQAAQQKLQLENFAKPGR